jgi:hypothetical protein
MNEVEVYRDPLTAVQVRAQVNLIQDVMKSVMQNGQHYGVIPGAGNKPTLLKPGAEKLMLTFHLSPDPIVEDLSTPDAHRYRVTCRICNREGHYLGAGLGEASSNEEKYKWRVAVCSEEFDETPEDRKRKKWKKGYGNEAAKAINQIRTEPADIANTILKMAKKRAIVDATLTVTAASDIFTQDIEDMPPEMFTRKDAVPEKPPLKEPAKKTETITPECVTTQVSGVESKTGTNPKTKKDYVIYGIKGDGDVVYKTFDQALADLARTAQEAGAPVKITYTVGKYGNDIKSLEIAEREPGAA